ncbi:hypothetical protein KY290_017938 [Solanum tuberosum]|uniref:Uncharacterized protein n=1 Tax=Solanum tuberosum TaxID=4113 RepID=A0ABQ7VCR9_SOLTU|nr:hypothetical protein KY285_016900 [Solanum tuberosum]KAH0761865.1 hypothetical protein KY290_017938 [Solanum tuberosum]
MDLFLTLGTTPTKDPLNLIYGLKGLLGELENINKISRPRSIIKDRKSKIFSKARGMGNLEGSDELGNGTGLAF